MRLCTPSQNAANRRKRSGTSSAFKGVCWSSQRKKWRARIRINGSQKRLGFFDSERAAAEAYDLAALSHFGEFAHINSFPT